MLRRDPKDPGNLESAKTQPSSASLLPRAETPDQDDVIKTGHLGLGALSVSIKDTQPSSTHQPDSSNKHQKALSDEPGADTTSGADASTLHGRASHEAEKPGLTSDATSDTEPEQFLRELCVPPVPYEKIAFEIKEIYSGLVLVEAKCIENDDRQLRAAQERTRTPLSLEQYSALIALHKTLLNECYDLLLLAQHPNGSPKVSKLPQKYKIPNRMWRHGIHQLLEIFRFRLPESFEPMYLFIVIVYQMITLLYEIIPTFENDWIEMLGDLARYRMAIEVDNIGDRVVWQDVARTWFHEAIDRRPEVRTIELNTLTIHADETRLAVSDIMKLLCRHRSRFNN